MFATVWYKNATFLRLTPINAGGAPNEMQPSLSVIRN